LKILTAEFVKSVGDDGIIPAEDLLVVALIGRSNVGKSTLVNTLVKQRIARAGRTPGTTRLLNVYRVQVSTGSTGRIGLTLVDLPGYGYARGGTSSRRAFDVCTKNFFNSMVTATEDRQNLRNRARLAGVIIALDARHPGLPLDLEAKTWAQNKQISFIAVMTKTDRLTRTALQLATRKHEVAFGMPVMAVSSKTGAGIEVLWRAIVKLL
jgi:GTP-binding protein